MAETTMHVPVPPALDPELLRDASFTIRARCASGPVLLHYDPRRCCAGVCHLANEFWSIWGPLEFDAFANVIRDRGIRIEDGDDLARWIAACSPAPTGGGLN